MYFEVPSTRSTSKYFFSDFNSELCTAVDYYQGMFSRLEFINKNSAGESESEATDDETHGRWQSEGGQDRKRSSFVETKEVSCLLLLSFYLICTS